MNDKEKLEMIEMCVAAHHTGQALEYFDDNSGFNAPAWVDASNNLGTIIGTILDGGIYRIANKRTTYLDDALMLVKANGYEVVKKEPEVNKFVPFVGQIISVWDQSYESRVTCHFSYMANKRFMCTSGCGKELDTEAWLNCEPIPCLVQFQPIEQLENGIHKNINLRFENGVIVYIDSLIYPFRLGELDLHYSLKTEQIIGFQKLDN